MKFIKITSTWYVRDNIIRDIWLSNNNLQFNVGYCISNMNADRVTCSSEEEAKTLLANVLAQLNGETSIDD